MIRCVCHMVTLAFLFLSSPALASAQSLAPTDLATRFKHAEKAVVATVVDVRPYRYRSPFGDNLIVSRLSLQVGDVLRGRAGSIESIDVDGGTLGGLTMRTSDLPVLKRGDRAVFLVNQDSQGRQVPYMRGLGILPLAADDTVRGTTLRLEDLRRIAQEAGR